MGARYKGLAEKGPDGARFTGVIRTRPEALQIPPKARKPQVYAVSNDLCHPGVPDEFIDDAVSAMILAAQHTLLVLTKRPERMVRLLAEPASNGLPPPQVYAMAVGSFADRLGLPVNDNVLAALGAGTCWPPPHIWLGATASNQEELNRVAPHLARLAAAGWNTFLSLEPLLAPVDIGAAWPAWGGANRLGQVIVGGETGHGARPMHPDWARQVRDDCADAGVPFFFKNHGGRQKSRVLDGRVHNALAWNAEGPRKGKR